MPYCNHCGAEVSDKAVVCPSCGVQIKPLEGANPVVGSDNGGFGWGLLGFCIPIVGIILYFTWKSTKPNNAKAAGTGALIAIVLYFLSVLFQG